ncbi:MAG: putative Se/S carrier-like protein [bacterium]
MNFILSFGGTHITMKVEKELKKLGVNCEIIPTPIESTVECSISIIIRDKSEEEVNEISKLLKYKPIKIKVTE